MTPRKPSDEELSREKILQVAGELFAAEGYRAVSMRRIAERLGCTHGALYYHFKEKAELFSAIVAADFAELTGLLERIAEEHRDDPATLIERICVAFVRFGLEHRPHYELMFLSEDAELRDDAIAERLRSYERFASVVTQAIRRIRGADGPPPVHVPWLAFLSLHGFVSYYLHSGQTFDDLRPLAEKHARFVAQRLAD